MSINILPSNNKYLQSSADQNNGRIVSLDVAKGLAMLFIIAGHLGSFPITRFVFTFHVPLFFLLSGYFYSYKRNLKSRITRYIKPYLFTVFLLLAFGVVQDVWRIILAEGNTHDLLATVYHWCAAGIYGSGSKTQFLEWHIPIVGAIWFLLALIWAILIMQIVNKKPLMLWQQEVVVLLLFAIGYFSAYFTWFPFSIQAGFSALLFVFIGYEVKRRKLTVYDKKEAILLSIILWGWSIYLSFSNDHMSLVRSCFPDILNNILGACAASYLIVLLCKKLESTFIAPFLITFGRYSIVVLCFHLIELTYFPWGIVNKIVPFQIISIAVIFLGKILFCFCAILLVQRSNTLKRIFSIK